MKLSDLLATHARPVEITHQSRWIDLLREKPDSAARSSIPQRESRSELRTMVAVRPEQLEAANALVRKRYAWRGYPVATQDAGSQRAGERGEPVTLLAEAGDRLLGTLTVRPHSPLYAEDTYGGEIGGLRRAGHRLGEVVKLAVETGVDWKGALDALVQGAYLVSRVLHALTDVVIEVNPRHVRFYDKVLGFSVLANGGMCTRVAAPSVLMVLDLELFGRRVQANLASR